MNKFEQLMNDLHVLPATPAWHDHQIVWNRALESRSTMDPVPHPRHRVGVAVVLYNELDVLLQHRRKDFGHGLYVLPGGTMDEADPVAAAVRELREELGIKIKPWDVEPLWIAHDQHANGEPYLMLYYAVNFTDRGTERNMEPEKCYGLSWYDMDHLPGQMWANDRRAIEALYWRLTR